MCSSMFLRTSKKCWICINIELKNTVKLLCIQIYIYRKWYTFFRCRGIVWYDASVELLCFVNDCIHNNIRFISFRRSNWYRYKKFLFQIGIKFLESTCSMHAQLLSSQQEFTSSQTFQGKARDTENFSYSVFSFWYSTTIV